MAEPPASLAWLARGAYAHRGLHDEAIPENSLASFRAAIAAGLGIECDIRKSGDGRAIVFHDATLDRMTDALGLVEAQSVGRLTSVALAHSEERIPTLLDALRLVAGDVPLLLELKTDRDRAVDPLCRAVRRDLEGYGGEVAVMSFDPRVSRWFSERLPDMPRGLVVTEENARTITGAIRRRLSIRRSRAQFLAYDVRDLPSGTAGASRKKGMPLLSWTVRGAAQLDTALAAGAAPILEGVGVESWRSRT